MDGTRASCSDLGEIQGVTGEGLGEIDGEDPMAGSDKRVEGEGKLSE